MHENILGVNKRLKYSNFLGSGGEGGQGGKKLSGLSIPLQVVRSLTKDSSDFWSSVPQTSQIAQP